jgi:ribosomal protein S18 acetylase RimI-like enzyme
MVPRALYPPDPAVRLRPVTQNDVEPLLADCWREYSLERAQEILRIIQRYTEQQTGFGIVALAEDNTTIIGYGQVMSWTTCAEISDLIVTTARRSQGIGTAIIQYLMQVAIRLKFPCVEIGVAASNPRALALYQLLGFEYGYKLELDLGQGKEAVYYLQMSLTERRL